MDAPTNGAGGAGGGSVRQPHKLRLAPPSGWAGWAVSEAQFAPGRREEELLWVFVLCRTKKDREVGGGRKKKVTQS